MKYPFYLIFLVFCSLANAQELKSFNQIKLDFKEDRDKSRLSYLFARCASLNLVNSALASRGGSKTTADKFQEAAVQYMEFSDLIEQEVDKSRRVIRSDKERANSVNISVNEIVKIYQARMNSNYARSGNYIIEDVGLKSEIEKCQNPNKLIEWVLGN